MTAYRIWLKTGCNMLWIFGPFQDCISFPAMLDPAAEGIPAPIPYGHAPAPLSVQRIMTIILLAKAEWAMEIAFTQLVDNQIDQGTNHFSAARHSSLHKLWKTVASSPNALRDTLAQFPLDMWPVHGDLESSRVDRTNAASAIGSLRSTVRDAGDFGDLGEEFLDV